MAWYNNNPVISATKAAFAFTPAGWLPYAITGAQTLAGFLSARDRAKEEKKRLNEAIVGQNAQIASAGRERRTAYQNFVNNVSSNPSRSDAYAAAYGAESGNLTQRQNALASNVAELQVNKPSTPKVSTFLARGAGDLAMQLLQMKVLDKAGFFGKDDADLVSKSNSMNKPVPDSGIDPFVQQRRDSSWLNTLVG